MRLFPGLHFKEQEREREANLLILAKSHTRRRSPRKERVPQHFSWHTRTLVAEAKADAVPLYSPATPLPVELATVEVPLLVTTEELDAIQASHIDIAGEFAKMKERREQKLARLEELRQLQLLQNVNLKLISLRQQQTTMRLPKQLQMLIQSSHNSQDTVTLNDCEIIH